MPSLWATLRQSQEYIRSELSLFHLYLTILTVLSCILNLIRSIIWLQSFSSETISKYWLAKRKWICKLWTAPWSDLRAMDHFQKWTLKISSKCKPLCDACIVMPWSSMKPTVRVLGRPCQVPWKWQGMFAILNFPRRLCSLQYSFCKARNYATAYAPHGHVETVISSSSISSFTSSSWKASA